MFEKLVAIYVTDQKAYTEYRKEMTPILQEFGGGFRYDFDVSGVRKTETPHPINRVFVIYFNDKAASEAFFADPRYLAVKEEHFEGAVEGVTVISEYDLPVGESSV